MFVEFKDNCVLNQETRNLAIFIFWQESSVFFQIVSLLGQLWNETNKCYLYFTLVERGYFNKMPHVRPYSKLYYPNLVHLDAVF